MIAGVKWVHDQRAARRYLLGLHMATPATILIIGVCGGRPHRTPSAIRCTIERLAAALLVTIAIATPALAQNGTHADQDAGTMRWDDGSFRAGDAVRLEPHIRFQTDVLLRDRSEPIDDRVDWPRRRIGIDGELFSRVEFQIERELEAETPWRDIYGDVKISRALRVRVGRFKVPFSAEQTTSGFELDFLERATAVEAMSPSRDLGVMVHGRPGLFKYEVGVFRHSDGYTLPADGGVTLPSDEQRLGLVAGRVAFAPIRDGKDGVTRDLEFGAAVTRSSMPEGLHGVVGHLANGDRFFEHMYVNGARTRLGLSGRWAAGRFTLKGELLQLTDERLQQAITGEDLSNLVTRGAYISGIWRAYGKRGRKKTAVDVEARLDRITFSSVNQTDEAFTNPRAEHVAPLSQQTWTFGATWIVNRWVRVQGNAIRQALIDPLGVRDLAPTAPWTALARLQFGL
jgi:phosphate-selective porin